MEKCFEEAFNLHYLCFRNYLLAEKNVFFMKNLALITALNYLGSFCKHSFKFPEKKIKNVIHQLSFVRIGKNRALCLEC